LTVEKAIVLWGADLPAAILAWTLALTWTHARSMSGEQVLARVACAENATAMALRISSLRNLTAPKSVVTTAVIFIVRLLSRVRSTTVDLLRNDVSDAVRDRQRLRNIPAIVPEFRYATAFSKIGKESSDTPIV
jgi:hypothetical protein